MVMNSSVARRSFGRSLRLLGGAAVALLMLSTATSQRAEALSPVNPGISGAKIIDNGLTIEVHGHGGGGGGGRGSGGGSFGPSVRGGSFSAGSPTSTGSGARVGRSAGTPGFAGRGSRHGFRHRHGVFIGGVYYDGYPYDYGYPYYDDPAISTVPGCRIVQTSYGPRPVCHRAARHHRHYGRHNHRRHHHA